MHQTSSAFENEHPALDAGSLWAVRNSEIETDRSDEPDADG